MVNFKIFYASVIKKRDESKSLSSAIVVIGNYENSNEVSTKMLFARGRDN
ncbi:hypothetical protein KYB31_19420 [Clostridium felsineum]|nr:hypothetical protein [Clostridium felsineum]MCR3761148.1 hypothetical protein [Clostridium felsineum]